MLTEQNKYLCAFHFVVGAITAREQMGMKPLTAKELFQHVYDQCGVRPTDSVTKALGLKVKEIL